MDEKRRSYLLKLARGKDFRRALHAIAELRASKDAAAAAALAPPAPGDEQRAFQYRVARTVLGDGMAALW